MMEDDDINISLDSYDSENVILNIPLRVPLNENGESYSEEDFQNAIESGRIAIHPVGDSAEETLELIRSATDTDPDDSIAQAVNCCTYLRRIGAEVLIYSSSFAGIGITTGLLIRYANTPALLSMLIGNGMAVMVNENARVFFSSLLKPHGDEVPEDQRSRYELIRKYATHPMSIALTSTVGGTSVSLVGSTNLGVRQAIVSCTAQLGGLTTYLANSALRECHGGSIVLDPGHEDVRTAMATFYSTEPNSKDENRPYLAGNMRNVTTRVVGMMAATLTSWYSGAYMLENYCGPEGRETLLDMQGNFTADDMRTHCFGGQATFLFRDWGVTAINMIGFLVLQPLLNRAYNSIFDYFYAPVDESDEENIGIFEEVSTDDSNDS